VCTGGFRAWNLALFEGERSLNRDGAWNSALFEGGRSLNRDSAGLVRAQFDQKNGQDQPGRCCTEANVSRTAHKPQNAHGEGHPCREGPRLPRIEYLPYGEEGEERSKGSVRPREVSSILPRVVRGDRICLLRGVRIRHGEKWVGSKVSGSISGFGIAVEFHRSSLRFPSRASCFRRHLLLRD
jgi:hypothetical protein